MRFPSIFRALSFVSFIIIALTGCGGGGGGDSSSSNTPPTVDLTGTWYGAYTDQSTISDIKIQVSGTSITSVFINNVDQNITGTISRQTDRAFLVAFSNGVTGGFVTDASRTHAALFTEFFEFGTVQLNATSLPTYLFTDSDGNWSGINVYTPDGVSLAELTSTGTCGSGICVGTFSNGVTATADLTQSFDSVYGFWGGTYTNSLMSSGVAEAFLSSDKQFVGVIACDYSAIDWSQCELSAWTRQTPTNSAPTADAGTNQTVSTGATVNLNASGSSDPDGDSLTYQWSFNSRPGCSSTTIASATSVITSFVPDVDGDYEVNLVVNDGTVSSSPDNVTITASSGGSIATGQTIYDTYCTSCHKAGNHDTNGPQSDLRCDGDLITNDMTGLPMMGSVPIFDNQEVLDLKTFLDSLQPAP